MRQNHKLSEDIHSLQQIIEVISEAIARLEKEIKKPYGDRDPVVCRALKDDIIIKTFILFDNTSRGNISLIKIPTKYKNIIAPEQLQRYNELLSQILNSNKEDIERIRLQRKKILAHLDLNRQSIFGFSKEIVSFMNSIGAELRQASDYKYEYIQADEVPQIPLYKNLDAMTSLLSTIKL